MKIFITGVKNGFRDKKIPLIKALRITTDLGLKEAKDIVEAMLDGYINEKKPFELDTEQVGIIPATRLDPFDNVLDYLVGNGFDAKNSNPIIFDSANTTEQDNNKCADCAARINVDTIIEVAELSGAIPDWFIVLLKKLKYGVM